jgi:sulfatase maturation enzyme AslB (radical SAM superfamily)
MITPDFMKTRHIDLAIATSAYCQARCSGCIWPFMETSNHILSVANFEAILDRFKDFSFGELALNIINEPFTDKTIIKKLHAIAARKQQVEVLYFSSNWLIPSNKSIEEFVAAIDECGKSAHIERIHINATLSGIDQHSYDVQQAGANLDKAIVPYRPLDFEKAVENVCSVLEALSQIDGVNKLKFRVKSYGDMYSLQEMQDFWADRFQKISIPEAVLKRQVKIGQNESFTTFARSPTISGKSSYGLCKRNWLEKRIVIGAQGEVGLCCEDGLRSIVIGNLLEQDLETMICNKSFQEHLAITVGKAAAPENHPCLRCSFYGVV